jgi:hypothetical protein
MKAHTLLLAVLALLFCGPIYSQQHKRQVPQRRVAVSTNYSNAPFDSSIKKLPAFFYGTDPEALYRALEAKKKRSTKDEFETSEDYRQRVRRDLAAPLIGNISQNSVLAFETYELETSYDADSGEMLITSKVENPIIGVTPNFERGSLKLSFKPEPTTTYIGSNAYGAKVVVKKQRSSLYYLLLENYADFVNDPGLSRRGYSVDKSISTKIKVDVVNAKRLKDSLRLLVVAKLIEPYIDEGFLTTKPTINDPTELFAVFEYLQVEASELLVYDITTGQVLKRLTASTAETVETSKPCKLSASEIPSLRGFLLGQTYDEVVGRFPRAMSTTSGMFDRLGIRERHLYILDLDEPGRFEDVSALELIFLDNALASVKIEYGGSVKWRDDIEFIKAVSESLRLPLTGWTGNRPSQLTCADFIAELDSGFGIRNELTLKNINLDSSGESANVPRKNDNVRT